MKKVKVGIVGLGRLGIEHARNLAFKIPNAELIAVCSVVQEEVDKVQREWGIPYGYTNYDEMIKNEELEAVAVLSPSPFHVKQIVSALDAGLHVFVDKPLGVTVEECREAEKAVERNEDKVFMVGFMRRYDPSYAYAKKLIDEGRIGKPFLIKCTSCDPEHTIDGAIRFAATSGGLFIDMAVHDIDLARWYLGSEVDQIYAIGGSYVHEEFAKYGDGDNVCSLMKFKDNSMALFYAGRDAAHGYQVETEIVGTKGSLRIAAEPAKNMCKIFDNNGVVSECSQSFQERFSEAYVIEMQEFINCIVEERKPDITVYDGTKNTEVAFAATKAFQENIVVQL
ncbi:MAG: inositol 2-dehydrogenase [Anaeromicrobium sp.]|jgi:myo-inositol 2-dehydrogenase/D-chiro-inositol 1-dehydrogenase|uniref:inositol 2-dehydrogenase n=1 Tax=Anaeromicrobium sp. TaxID=1929132 RepID=UPI0025F031E1|nr:inositol 2-dehydrogenase [Anaeromicrobium sp.]MCT4593867.1 inositol 2-dehydrogenase [Anaeromicrobium sp.]